MQVPNKAVGSGRRERQREPPEIPLKGDDGHGGHTGPDHTEGGLATGEARVEEAQAGDHDHDHGRSSNEIGLVTGLEPFVEVFGSGVASEFVGREGIVVGGGPGPVVGGVVGGVGGLHHGYMIWSMGQECTVMVVKGRRERERRKREEAGKRYIGGGEGRIKPDWYENGSIRD